MPHDDTWLIRIEDMLVAAEEIVEFTKGKSLEQFRASPMLTKAVLHDFALLGEAANHVPEDVRERHANIPWHRLRGMRT